jgi:hypothetical protein
MKRKFLESCKVIIYLLDDTSGYKKIYLNLIKMHSRIL